MADRGGRWLWLVILAVLVLGLGTVGLLGRAPHGAPDGAPDDLRRAERDVLPRATVPRPADRSAEAPRSTEPGRPAAPPTTPAPVATPAVRSASPSDPPAADGASGPPKTCDVLVRVTAAGAAKPGAVVSLFGEPPDDAWRGQAWLPTRHSANTGPEGEATITGLQAGVYKPVARAAGLTTRASRPFRCRGDGSPVELALELEGAGACVNARVVDRDGGPLAHSWALLRNAGGFDRSELPVAVDPTGRLQACPPADGRWTLMVGAVGHEPGGKVLTPEDANAELVVDVVRTSVIKGRVVGPDGPAAGANVPIAGAPHKGRRTAVSDQTDADGRFTLTTGGSSNDLGVVSPGLGLCVHSAPRGGPGR